MITTTTLKLVGEGCDVWASGMRRVSIRRDMTRDVLTSLSATACAGRVCASGMRKALQAWLRSNTSRLLSDPQQTAISNGISGLRIMLYCRKASTGAGCTTVVEYKCMYVEYILQPRAMLDNERIKKICNYSYTRSLEVSLSIIIKLRTKQRISYRYSVSHVSVCFNVAIKE